MSPALAQCWLADEALLLLAAVVVPAHQEKHSKLVFA
jgi:hypothetical protein